jgi:hypothetical protein
MEYYSAAIAGLYPHGLPPSHKIHWRTLREQIRQWLANPQNSDCPPSLYCNITISNVRQVMKRFREKHGL